MTGERKAVRCLVEGRVQGVYFRGSTAREAQRLGLTGWAKNLADGRVEVVAEGDATAVEALVEWLWQGPRMARVTSVTVEECDAASGAEFQIL